MTAVSQFVRGEQGRAEGEHLRAGEGDATILVNQRDALKQTLDVAPLALNNLFLAYNPNTGTLDQRANIGENVNQLVNDPALVLCATRRAGRQPRRRLRRHQATARHAPERARAQSRHAVRVQADRTGRGREDRH